MKRYIAFLFVALMLAVSLPAFSDNPTAEEQFGVGQPLMIIRFNQPNVYYQVPLYKTVKKALEIYPNANFQILSVIPTTGDYKQDNQGAEEAAKYAGLVTNALGDMGLPSTRYSTNYTSDSSLSNHEVRIFVR